MTGSGTQTDPYIVENYADFCNMPCPNDNVCRREMNSGSPLIFGYARPNYSQISGNVQIVLPLLTRGDTEKFVKVLQILLNAYGYDVGSCGADGDFGSDTEKAVKNFQKDNSLDVDGIVGHDTWSELLR